MSTKFKLAHVCQWFEHFAEGHKARVPWECEAESAPAALELFYRAQGNNLMGVKHNPLLPTMCTGDVVMVIGTPDEFWYCDTSGWRKMTTDEYARWVGSPALRAWPKDFFHEEHLR